MSGKTILCVAVAVSALLFANLPNLPAEVIVDWVTVGDPGNVDDVHGAGYGGVDYVYRIGKYEVTNAEYCEFLNAVASDDPNGLYSTGMGGGLGGITRSGSAGSYTYSLITGRGYMPVSYVSWYDVLRFVNWMHNGQPTGIQDAPTTEDGAYDMSLGSEVVRKVGARVCLPTEDEWYKAAYYKGGGPDAGYWDYPTQSDTPPTAEAPPGTDTSNGSANYDWAVSDFTAAGAYTRRPSDSAYSTFDQGGNVWEWVEADIFGDGSARGVRGGSFDDSDYSLRALARLHIDPSFVYSFAGFRIVECPEVEGDLDGDRDVDLEDFVLFEAAFTGPTAD